MKKRLLSCFLFPVLAVPGSHTLAQEDHQPEVKILQPGVKLTLIAEQPDIATPTGVDVDDKGRVWAVYPEWWRVPERSIFLEGLLDLYFVLANP